MNYISRVLLVDDVIISRVLVVDAVWTIILYFPECYDELFQCKWENG
jgi:hypothetical protein